jgi:beta-lactam-binding protein with PASTA domain
MSDKKKDEIKYYYFKSIGRIALIFFLGFSLYLFISTMMLVFLTKPSKEVKTPDLVGKKYTDVHNNIVRSGLRPELKFKDVFDLDEGMVLAQHPEPGEIISEGNPVKITLSRSAFYIDTPSVIGMELPMALNKVKSLHYRERSVSIGKGVISYIPSDKNAENIVIGQSPRAGEKITPDRKINLLVSSGKAQPDANMPDITGQSLELCYDLLLSKGIFIQEDIANTGEFAKSGIIYAQNPGKGAKLDKGSTVKLNVGHYPMTDKIYIGYETVEYKIPDGEKAGLYEAYIDDNSSRRTRFSAIMKPGQIIKFMFQRVGNARVSIVCDKKPVKILSIKVD